MDEPKKEVLDSLEKSIEDSFKPLAFRKESQQQVLDYDKLMAIGERLLKQKLDEHMAATTNYERARVELVDSYRVRMERLKLEAEDQLRTLEETHFRTLENLEKLIGKLKTLREV
jgi:hypothetical protein